MLCPSMGKVKIAQTLARAGLHLGTTTVGRMLKGGEDAADLSPAPSADCGPEASTETIDITADDHDGLGKSRVVTANRPNHVWHVDLTSVPTAAGFCTTWLPFALPQSWPFCWWVAVAIDHFSRRVMGIAAFPRQPTSVAVRTFLGRAIAKAGTAPKYLVCDRGSQFDCQGFRGWCERSGIKPPRYGAIGRGTRLRVAGASPWLNASS